MGKLADFEDSIGKVIEGTFGGIFRSHVQPAEIARMCAKEMDRSKKLGVGKVYVANFYHIILSPRDGDALGGLTAVLTAELETYLLAHARENNYQLPTRPAVNFITDPELRLGKFDVIGETMSQAEIDRELGIDEQPPAALPRVAPAMPGAAPTAVGPVASVSGAGPSLAGIAPETATLATTASDDDAAPIAARLISPLMGAIEIGEKDLYTIGRKETCDIRLDDSAASRLHATMSCDGSAWIITDNESTNVTQINGHPITTRRLKTGDVITIGTTQLTYRVDELPPPAVPAAEASPPPPASTGFADSDIPATAERALIKDLL